MSIETAAKNPAPWDLRAKHFSFNYILLQFPKLVCIARLVVVHVEKAFFKLSDKPLERFQERAEKVVSEKVVSKVLFVFLYKKNHDPYKNF